MIWLAVFKCASFQLCPLDGPHISAEEPNVFDTPMYPADSRNTHQGQWGLGTLIGVSL